jgi:hypothetical protein
LCFYGRIDDGRSQNYGPCIPHLVGLEMAPGETTRVKGRCFALHLIATRMRGVELRVAQARRWKTPSARLRKGRHRDGENWKREVLGDGT